MGLVYSLETVRGLRGKPGRYRPTLRERLGEGDVSE